MNNIYFIHIPKNAGSTMTEIFLKEKNKLIGNFYFRKVLRRKYNKKTEIFEQYLEKKYNSLMYENKLLYENFDNQIIYNKPNRINFWHIPMYYWKQKYIDEYKKKNIIFCIIRNPYERVLSLFNHWISMYSKEENPINKKKNEYIFDNYFDKTPENLNRFIHKIFKNNDYIHYLDGHLIPQYYYVYDTKNNQIPNSIIRYENLEEEFQKFSDKYELNIDIKNLESVQIFRSVSNLDISDLDDDSIHLINKYYALDFEYLNYNKINTLSINNNLNKLSLSNKEYEINIPKMKYEINKISPIIELKRLSLLNKLKEEVTKICKNENINLKVDNFISKFILYQFFDKKIKMDDPIFPRDSTNFEQVIDDLKENNPKIKENEIDSFIKKLDLKNKFNNMIDELKIYIDTKLNIEDLVYRIDESFDDKYIYYRIEIDDNDKTTDIVKDFNFSQVKVSKIFLEKLEKRFIFGKNKRLKNSDFFKKLVICLIIRYNIYKNENQHQGLNPIVKEYFKNKFNMKFELLTSGINSYFDNYFSLFYDIEKYFGSKGNLFTSEIKKGCYFGNFMFKDALYINKIIDILVNNLNKSKKELSFFITIPLFEKNIQKNIDEKIKKNKFLTYEKNILKNNVKFYNYIKDEFNGSLDIKCIFLQNKQSINLHKINNKLQNEIQNIFSKNFKISGGNKNKNFINENDYLSLTFINNKNLEFKNSLKFGKNPKDYQNKIDREYYSFISNRNKNYLLSLNINTTKQKNYMEKFTKKRIITKKREFRVIPVIMSSLLELFFQKKYDYDNIAIIDLSYLCGLYKVIENRQRILYLEISNFLLKKKNFTNFNIDFISSPLYSINSKNTYNIDYIEFFDNLMKDIGSKKNFVILNATLEYFELKAISYYTEQVNYLLLFSQIFYLLNILEKNGSAIGYFYTFCSKVNQNLLKLLIKYFDKTSLFKHKVIKSNSIYLVCEKFKGISEKKLNQLKNIYIKIFNNYKNIKSFGENYNVFNKELRKEKNIVKFIKNFQTDEFVHNIIDIEETETNKKIFKKKITKFNKEFFKLNTY